MRSPALLAGVVVTLTASAHSSQTAPAPILTRDIDKRPLPKVTMQELSPAMQKAVQALIDELKRDETPADKQATPPSLDTTVYRIPIAPRDHRLYFVDQTGELGCSPNGANCTQTVLDETASGIVNVTGNGDSAGAGISVVRRPNRQMPDIAAHYQLGHFAMDITVFRWNGTGWHPYLCKELDPINEDPHPAIVADKPCRQ